MTLRSLYQSSSQAISFGSSLGCQACHPKLCRFVFDALHFRDAFVVAGRLADQSPGQVKTCPGVQDREFAAEQDRWPSCDHERVLMCGEAFSPAACFIWRQHGVRGRVTDDHRGRGKYRDTRRPAGQAAELVRVCADFPEQADGLRRFAFPGVKECGGERLDRVVLGAHTLLDELCQCFGQPVDLASLVEQPAHLTHQRLASHRFAPRSAQPGRLAGLDSSGS